jgi:excisionase family DNA binding protein
VTTARTIPALNQRVTVSVDEAMKALGVCRDVIYDLLKSGNIRSFKMGRRRLVVVQSLYEWAARMESQQNGEL